MKNKLRLILLLSLVGCILFLWSCKKKEYITNITQVLPLPSIIGQIGGQYDLYNDTSYTFVWVEVDNFPSIPYVSINNDTIPMIMPGEYGVDGYPLVHGQTYDLRVNSSAGEANASTKYPGLFSVIEPPTGTTWLNPGDSLNVIWTTSAEAEWYGVSFSWELGYIDTLTWIFYEKYIDTLIITDDTSMTFTANFLWEIPPGPYLVVYADGDLEIVAVVGPRFQPGAQGNVTGNGIGFFFGFYSSDEYDIDYWLFTEFSKTEVKPTFEQLREKTRKKLLELVK